jgi:putative signal transducing protein
VRRVHCADSILEIAHLRNVLQTAGIACVVRNERLATLAGEIPFVECWPELWVCRSGDALRARGLIDLALGAADDGPSWTCNECGELVEPQFAECWRCAGDRDAVSDPVSATHSR